MKACLWIAVAGSVVAVVVLDPPRVKAQSNDCTISLQPSQLSPQLVGDRIVWTASAANCGQTPVFQFSVAANTDPGKEHRYQIVRDYSPLNTFIWAPMQEGAYHVMVRVKKGFNVPDSTSAAVSDFVNPRVTAGEPIVTPTQNPLVALYSAPPCRDGSMFVRFRPAGDANTPSWISTNRLPCVPGRSRNFLLGGMLANTTYEMVHVTNAVPWSFPLLLTTGTPPSTLDFPRFTVRQVPTPGSDPSQKIIYHNLTSRPAPNAVNLLATDLSGGVEWYSDPIQGGVAGIAGGSSLVAGGTVLLPGRDQYGTVSLNVLREVDLAGNPLRETNVDAVNAQLMASGQKIIFGFHHEILRLPNGDTATLGWTLKMVDVNGNPSGYVGVALIVLDQDFQVAWTWDAFDHLDVGRGPILGETCTGPCPIPGAVDWLHANAIAWSAADENLLISLRHQDWLIKIDYAGGEGDGHIIWRLGKDGDFTINSADPYPWFSHQHNPHYLDDCTLALFDNGNTRCFGVQECHSRGQVLILDEQHFTASSVVNLDLKNYSNALGSAERLPNGNFIFTSGSQGDPPSLGQSIEVLPDGTQTYVLEVGALEYHSSRMSDLYGGIHR
jgi:hypothetical protein